MSNCLIYAKCVTLLSILISFCFNLFIAQIFFLFKIIQWSLLKKRKKKKELNLDLRWKFLCCTQILSLNAIEITTSLLIPWFCSVFRKLSSTSSRDGYFLYGSTTYPVLATCWPKVQSATWTEDNSVLLFILFMITKYLW